VDKIISLTDTNKDGFIDYEEFCNFIYKTESEMESAIGKVEFSDQEEVLKEPKEEKKVTFKFDEEGRINLYILLLFDGIYYKLIT
jgi:hypothetical protein